MKFYHYLIMIVIFFIEERFIIRWEIKNDPELFKDINLNTRDLEEIAQYRERKNKNDRKY